MNSGLNSFHMISNAIQTNFLMKMHTGNYVVDMLTGLFIASTVCYAVKMKSLIYQKIEQWTRCIFSDRYALKYNGRIYLSRSNESLTETFVAVTDWVIDNLMNNQFEHAHTLTEIQLPKSMRIMPSTDNYYRSEDDEYYANKARKFNESIMLLDQITKISHKKYDIHVRHECYKGQQTEGEEELFKRNREYQEHTITLSSNTLTTRELTNFVNKHVVNKYREKRENEENNKLFYFLFQNQNEEQNSLSYEKYEWNSTKLYKHIISENTDIIVKRVDHFINNRQWYIEHGKPYSLTILLYGPPGCGKTSLIKAVANATRRHIKEIPLPRVQNRQTLMDIFHGDTIYHKTVRPSDFIFVFEEFDKMGSIIQKDDTNIKIDNDESTINKKGKDVQNSMFKALEEKYKISQNDLKNMQKMMVDQLTLDHKNKEPKLSLGCILNVMDGILENNGTITFLTANNIDNIHEAILRPGRIDLKLKLGFATTKSFKIILKSIFNKKEEKERIDKISDVDIFYNERWSPADIEEVCFSHNLEETLEYFSSCVSVEDKK